jgi:hypothetical protein
VNLKLPMSTQFLSREDYPELYAAIAKAYGPLPGKDFELPPIMTTNNRAKSVSQDEAIDFLNLCKTAYTKAINESDQADIINQCRIEIRYWEDYLHANWPEERAKREPFGGKSEPMSKVQLIEAMDHVYERLRKIPEIVEEKPVASLVEIYGSLKTLCAVVDELIRKLP